MKLFPHILVALVGAVILILQWSHHRDLQKQLAQSGAEKPTTSLRSQHRVTSPVELLAKREKMMTDLEQYLESGTEKVARSRALDLLALIPEATAEDLSTLITRIEQNDPSSPGLDDTIQFDSRTSLLWTLKLLQSELNPSLVLRSENRPEAFMSLARKSSNEALAWLEASNLTPEERKGFMGLFRQVRLSQDPAKHLEAWKEENLFPFSDNVVLLESGGIPDLLEVVHEPENSEIRDQLISSIIYSSLLEEKGLARTRVESLDLEASEIVAILEPLEDLGSEETLEWAISLGGEEPEKTLNLQESFMAKFAQTDLEGAAKWLKEFDGSALVRDEMTKRYAMVLSAVDPEAALPWIERVENPITREWVKGNLLITWEIDDPEGFARWQKQ